jgi:hypothetical protein
MANAEARHHHYIPQCYLRNFATGSGKQARISVAALRGSRWFETGPRNIAGVRDFLRINVEGHKPDELETEMAQVEGKIADSIRNVKASLKFEGDDRIAILNLIALLAVRSPQMREAWRKAQEKDLKKMMDLTLATKEQWESEVEKMKKAGYELKEPITYEQLKEFHDKGEYNVELNNEWHIRRELEGMEIVLGTLVRRKWRLYVADEPNGPFVTSDRPVILNWTHPEKVPPFFRSSPGYGMPETEVYFPLSPNLALVGMWEDDKEGTHRNVPASMVANGNTKIIDSAFEQVYTIEKTVPYFCGPPMIFYQDDKFMERYSAAKAKLEAS